MSRVFSPGLLMCSKLIDAHLWIYTTGNWFDTTTLSTQYCHNNLNEQNLHNYNISHFPLLYPNIPVLLLVTFTPFLITNKVPSILNTEFMSGWWAISLQPCKCQVSAAARAPLNLNAHCRTVFFLPYENYVHLIEQCCLIYPLKLNFVTTK